MIVSTLGYKVQGLYTVIHNKCSRQKTVSSVCIQHVSSISVSDWATIIRILYGVGSLLFSRHHCNNIFCLWFWCFIHYSEIFSGKCCAELCFAIITTDIFHCLQLITANKPSRGAKLGRVVIDSASTTHQFPEDTFVVLVHLDTKQMEQNVLVSLLSWWTDIKLLNCTDWFLLLRQS